MVKAVLLDVFETLITESRTRPPGVSSLAPALGCEHEAFRLESSATASQKMPTTSACRYIRYPI